jgi:hypothetical protein
MFWDYRGSTGQLRDALPTVEFSVPAQSAAVAITEG